MYSVFFHGTLSQQSHYNGSPCKQGKPKSFFASQLFSKDKIGEDHCYQHAELIHRSHDTGRSFLEGSPVAQPGGSCGHAGQADKGQFFSRDLPDLFFPFPGRAISECQAMTRTTQVRMAVPRLDSISEIPIFPRIAVRLAKTAEPAP